LNDNLIEELLTVHDEKDKLHSIYSEHVKPYLIEFTGKVELDPRITYCDQVISTPGNITLITGESKSGKSGLIAALCADSLSTQNRFSHKIITKVAPQNCYIVHIDTEHSIPINTSIHNKIHMRSDRVLMDNLLSLNYRTLHPKEKIIKLKNTLELINNLEKRIHLIVIDGISDFVGSVNNEEDSNEAVAELERLARIYNCPVICVLHYNPNSKKARGHLGSQLHRKAESILHIGKGSDNSTSVLTASTLRNGEASECTPVTFFYNQTSGYHVELHEKFRTIDEYNKELKRYDLLNILKTVITTRK